MEFRDVVRQRRMVRTLLGDPIDPAILDEILDDALRAPTAGNSKGVDLLVLTEQAARSKFWGLIGESEWLTSTGLAEGLVVAPTVVVPIGNPSAYMERYASPEKSASVFAGLDRESWPVPYWTVDASFVAMSILLGVTNAGLGALFFHLQTRERRLLEGFGVPDGHVPIGAIAIGRRAPTRPPSGTARRAGRGRSTMVHREHW